MLDVGNIEDVERLYDFAIGLGEFRLLLEVARQLFVVEGLKGVGLPLHLTTCGIEVALRPLHPLNFIIKY